MDHFQLIGAVFGLFSLVSLFNKTNDKETPKAYSEIPKNKYTYYHGHATLRIFPTYNYTNGVFIHDSLFNYYKGLLSLNEVRIINHDVIYDHFLYKIESLETAENLGLSQNYDIHDLIAAREYMYDLCSYFGNKN